MTNQTVTFEIWFAELKKVAIEQYQFSEGCRDSFDADAFREYFDDGYSPAEAIEEDLSYA